MENNFNLLLAENRRKMGEEAAARGSESAARANFKIAAESYRKVADTDIKDRAKWLQLAEQMQSLADGATLSAYAKPAEPQPVKTATVGGQPKEEVKKPTERREGIDEDELNEALESLNELIGLNGVKTQINDWVKQIRVFKVREERGLPIPL